jgi:hypothetical protein
MKSTNNTQTTEDMNHKAIGYASAERIAFTERSFIVEELSDEAQSAISGGRDRQYISDPNHPYYWMAFGG